MVTGLVDAVSFLGLGHIFTANMTGNVVFFGFACRRVGICQPTDWNFAVPFTFYLSPQQSRLKREYFIALAASHLESHLVMNGIDLYTVKELLGHSDIKVTEIYAHLAQTTLPLT
jgi:hypothetical protein